MASVDPENRISITEASKLGLSALVREVEAGNDRILVRNNKPVAVMMSMERFERLQQLQEDLIDVTLVAARMATTGPERYSLDDVLAHFGFTREELAASPEQPGSGATTYEGRGLAS